MNRKSTKKIEKTKSKLEKNGSSKKSSNGSLQLKRVGNRSNGNVKSSSSTNNNTLDCRDKSLQELQKVAKKSPNNDSKTLKHECELNNSNQFQCKICSERFKHRQSFIQHKKRIHPSEQSLHSKINEIYAAVLRRNE